MNKETLIYGAGGHGKVVASVVEACDSFISGFIDEAKEVGSEFFNSQIVEHNNKQDLIIAVGDNESRKKIAKKLENKFVSFIHPSAIVHPSVKIGVGTVIMAGAIIQPDTVIGDHVIINTGACIDHDCVIENFSHIAPGVHLCGGVQVGEGTLLGVGSSVIPQIKIGNWVTAGAGAVIVKDIEDKLKVVGNPVKVVK